LEHRGGNQGPHIVVRTDPRCPEQVFYGREAALAWYRGLWESGKCTTGKIAVVRVFESAADTLKAVGLQG
jgi:hypothetical protein